MVLTGTPPNNMTQNQIVQIALDVLGVHTVQPVVNEVTDILVQGNDGVNTAKAKKAKKLGYYMHIYYILYIYHYYTILYILYYLDTRVGSIHN